MGMEEYANDDAEESEFYYVMEAEKDVPNEEVVTTKEDGRPESQSTNGTRTFDKDVQRPSERPRTTLGRGRACVPCR
jgi:hypothetical protein